MSILNVNKINPVGGGSTITIAGIASVTNNVSVSGSIVAGTTITGEHHGDGSNLTSIPAGNLTGTVADARITTLTASKLSGALPAISGANLTGISAGKILQVVSTTRTDTFSESGISESAHSGAAISVTITPTSSSSKIYLVATLTMGLNNDNEGSFAFFRGGSIISGAIGDAAGSRTRTGFGCFVNSTSTPTGLHGSFLDSPNTTSATTYDCRLSHGMNGGNGTVYLNRSHGDQNADQDSRYASTLTVMEVAV